MTFVAQTGFRGDWNEWLGVTTDRTVLSTAQTSVHNAEMSIFGALPAA
jgi:hypothetical protein